MASRVRLCYAAQSTLLTSQMHVTDLKGQVKGMMDRLDNAAFLVIESGKDKSALS